MNSNGENTLEDLRARFASGSTKSKPPDAPEKPSIDTAKLREHRAAGSAKAPYELTLDADNARLSFGKYKGSLLSELAEFDEGVSYLRWLCRTQFPDELRGLAKRWAASTM